MAIGERDGKRKGMELARGPKHLTLLLLKGSRNSSMKARTLIFFISDFAFSKFVSISHVFSFKTTYLNAHQ